MRTLEAQGKSIDEAIFNGLRELGVSIDEVEIDIIQQESKGVLGFGVKPAKVRLIEREPEQIVIPEYLTDAERTRTGERSGQSRDRNRGRNNNRERGGRRDNERYSNQEGMSPERREGERTPAPRQDGARRDNQRRSNGNGNGQRRDREREEYRPDPNKPQIPYTAEAAENEPAAMFLKGLLELMGVEASVLANVTEEGVRLRIDSGSMGILIGHRGETLDALQYLTSLHINRSRKETGYTRVTIDTEGYRDKREDTLIRLARKVASQVRSTGRPRALEPMNPYERRVLHSTLQNNPYVTTYSEGEEAERHVVVALRDGISPAPRNDRRERRPYNKYSEDGEKPAGINEDAVTDTESEDEE